MTTNNVWTCELKGGAKNMPVLALVVHHEVARFPEAVAIVSAENVALGDGPYLLALRDDVGGPSIEGLGASAWYVIELTRLSSPAPAVQNRWLLRLGVIEAQQLPMRALVCEGQSAQDILKDVCETRANLTVEWSGEAFSRRLGTVISLQETLETFLRRFAHSLNCWFVYSGKAGLRWTQESLGAVSSGLFPCSIPGVAMTKVAAPPVVRVFWSMSFADLTRDAENSKSTNAYEIVQPTELDIAEPVTEWVRPPEWVLHHGLSDDPKLFALCAGQFVGAQGHSALAVLHVWMMSDPGQDDSVRTAFRGVIPGLLPDAMMHCLAEGTNFATLSLSVEQAAALRYVDGALLLSRQNLRSIAKFVSGRLHMGSATWQPSPTQPYAGAMVATVASLNGKTETKLKESDYAALSASKSPHLRSSRLNIRFDWHSQAVQAPYASPWAGSGGTMFFPHRVGDRVLVQFIGGDLSAPVVVAAMAPEQAAVQEAFQSPGEPFHANQPQGISARDGLVLETTESGDLILYAKKGNLVLRARDTVVIQGRLLDESFARTTSTGNIYEREE